MIEFLSKIEDRYLLFVLVIFLVLCDLWTASPTISDSSKVLLGAFAGIMTARAKGQAG